MWAVGKGRSQSGHGMLLANPHLRWEGAQLFHEIQLTVPGRINVTGATLIGFPVVLIGFNDYMGWSLTVNEHHADSVYELELNPQNPNEYLYDGGMLPLRSTSFSIDVKTDSGIVKRTETELWSHYGPIIRIQGNKAYAYNSPNLANVNFLSEFNLMAKARSFTEFRGALGMQEIPMFNLAYTDRDGNVFYLYNGRFPVRPKGHDWSKPVSGSDSSTEWYTILPIAELPQLYDPPSGFIQNCNDAPWYVTTGESIDHTQYPAYEGDSEVGWRGQASIRILESAPAITLEEIKKDKYSEHLLLAERLKPELVELARQSQNTSPEMQEAVKVLEKWQDRATAQSEGAMLFVKWWDEYRRSTHKLFQVDWAADQPFSTPRGIGDPKAAMTALISAITWSKTTYGKLDVPWGEVHRLRRGNLDVAVGGLSAMGSLRSIAFREGPANRWTGIGGDSYVLAVEFTDPPTAFSVLEYSESSDTQSKHFNDQLKLFAEEGYKQLWTREKDIKAHTERAYHPGE